MSAPFVWVDSTSWELEFFGLPSRIPWPADADPQLASAEPFDHETLVRAIDLMGADPGQPWAGFRAASEHFEALAEVLDDAEGPEAMTLLDEVESVHPGTAFVAFHRGIVARQDGHYAEAIGHFETAARTTPKVHTIWMQLGLLQAQEGDRDKAIKALVNAVRLNPKERTAFEALASLKAAVKVLRDPKDPNSVAYLDIPQYRKMCEQQLSQLQNNPQQLLEFGEFQVHHEFASELGLRALVRARELAPNDPRPLAALSNAYRAVGQPEQAKALALELTERFPTQPPAWLHLAQILGAAGDREGESAAFEKALEIDPNLAPAIANVFHLSDGPSAENEQRLAAFAEEKKAPVAFLLASDSAHARGDDAAALDYAARAFAVEPEREEVLLHYCAMIGETKDESRLRRDIEPALHAAKYTKRLDWNFAHALKQLGHINEAISVLISAASAEGAPADFQHTVGSTIDLWTHKLAKADAPIELNKLGSIARPVLLSVEGEDGATLLQAGQTLPAEARFPFRVRIDGQGETHVVLQQGQTGGVGDPHPLGSFAIKALPVTGGTHTLQCIIGAGPDGRLLFKAIQGAREVPVRWVAPKP